MLRDSGKLPVSQVPDAGMAFKAQQLKQLRAQCIVFLALRNGLKPKELHLEIALGNVFTKEEEPQKDHDIGKEQFVNDPNSTVEQVRKSLEKLESSGSSSLKDSDNAKKSQQN